MSARQKAIAWLAVLVGVGAGVAVFAVQRAAGMRAADQSDCTQRLNMLWSTIELYRRQEEGNRGRYPASLDELVKRGYFPDSSWFVCRGAQRNLGSQTKQGPVQAYAYIDWSTEPRDADWGTGKYPVIYDQQLASHGGRGVNIVMADGTVQWDADAQWLAQFAAKHPKAKVPLPR